MGDLCEILGSGIVFSSVIEKGPRAVVVDCCYNFGSSNVTLYQQRYSGK